MTFAAVAASVAVGAYSANKAGDAADTMANSANQAGQDQLTGMREALDAQTSMFDFGLGANAAQSELGYGALGAMSNMLGMPAPKGDTTNYNKQIDQYKAQLAKVQKQREQLSATYKAGKLSGSDARAQTTTYKASQADLKKKLEAAQRSQKQQTIQNRALSQFTQGSEGAGAAGLEQIQKFDFNFDESQLGQTDSYKFRQEQSLEALDRRLASGGMRGSGNRYAGILDLAQNMASQEYEAEYGRQYGAARDKYSSQFDIYNMFAGMSGMAGVNAQQAAGVGGNMAGIIQQGYGGMADARMAAGQAGAAGIMGQNNAAQNMMSQIFQIGGDAGWFDNDE